MKSYLKIVILWLTVVPSVLWAQVVPELEIVTPDVCIPQPVKLKVKNCSGCTGFEWKIGTGAYQSGTDQYSTILTQAGTYDVVVVVTTASGLKYPISKTAAFRVHAAPAINLKYNRQAACNPGDTFVFTDSTKNSVSRDWMMESHLMNNGPRQLQYVFTPLQGYKRVYMVVRDSWGCAASKLFDSFFGVWNTPRVYPSESERTGCAPRKISFSVVDDLQGQTLNYHKWWFPKASPDSVISNNPLVTFSKSDTFSYAVELVTRQGCSTKVVRPGVIIIGDSARLVMGTIPSALCVNQQLTFSVSGSKTLNPQWQFTGAGSFKTDTSSGVKITGRFTDTGWVSVKVSETTRGCTSYASANRASFVRGPRASFQSLVPNYCTTPDTVNLQNNSVEGPSTTWRWTVYDSNGTLVNTSISRHLKYPVNTINKYSARLIAKSTNGCSDTLYLPNVMVGGSISADFTITPNPNCAGEGFTFKAKAGPGTSVVKHYFKWYKYDENGKVIFTTDAPEPQFSYLKDGIYHAKLLISNTRGCQDSLLKIDSVKVVSPKVSIRVQDTLICAGAPLWLIARRISVPKGYTSYWEAIHLDSLNVKYWIPGDSVDLRITKPGPYRLQFSVQDPLTNRCKVTVVHPFRLKVSGAKVQVTASPSFGCAPLAVSFSSKIDADYNYIQGAGPLTYAWKRSPRAGFPITDSTKASFSTTIKEGLYNYYLWYRNNSGCADSTAPGLIQSGVISRIGVASLGRCKGTRIQLLSSSSQWADSVRYVCDSPGIRFEPGPTDPSPKFIATKGGKHVVKLIAKYKNCSDTSEVEIDVVEAVASFWTADTVTYCAPKLVQIYNTTPNAMYTRWYFGDGDSTVSFGNGIANHIFARNNQRPGYDMKMIVENYLGCRDTIFKKGYFRVIGPVPELKLVNFKGCEPLKVQFQNNSLDYRKFYLDYGDGTVMDSIGGQTHVYNVTDKLLPIQVFRPKMLVADSFGCIALALPDDSVQVLKNAEPLYSFTSARFLRRTEGCAGDLLVSFTDRSRFSVRNYWDFDGDGTIDIRNQPTPNYLYGNPGVFFPVLIAEHANGCKDTFRRDSIIAWEKPEPAFRPNRDSFCARDEVKFTYTGTSKYPISSYYWDFAESGLLNDTSTKKDTKWKYRAPFDHPVSLLVKDVKGCTKTFVRGVYVLDTAGPARPEVAFVTVQNNRDVVLNWHKSGLGNYYKYHIYLDSTKYLYNFSRLQRADTTASMNKGNTVSNTRYCYALKIEDTCSQQGKMSVSHCTMVLRDTAKELYHLHLKWLSYDGWSTELSHYEVFRKDPGGSFKRIASVSPWLQTYTDSFLCDQDYCYYVEAVNKNRVHRSRSNEVCDRPIYRKPAGTSHISLVTVQKDSFPYIRWQSTYSRIPGSSYVLERSASGNAGTFQYVREVTKLETTDPAMDAHAAAFYYRVVFKDHCGETGDPGAVSNSIHLRRGSGTGKLTIDWNDYKYWHSGVKEYHLQVKQRNGTFKDWITFSPGQTEKDSVDLEQFSLDTICFRVAAFKDSLNGDTSLSNTLCFVPGSYLWVPSGFTPNNNGLNEVFRPVSGYVFGDVANPSLRYEFRIVNRWGQIIFETNNPTAGWDGTLGGERCQDGLYIWEVKAVGFDGIAHRKKGTIYLMR